MFNFSAGRARLVPAGGGTPLELGVVQNATVELKVDLKELRGAYRYPIAVADGKGTASGKVSFAQIWPETLAAITGGTNGSGAPMAIVGEQAVIATDKITLTEGTLLVPDSEIVTVIVNGSPVFYARVAAGAEAAAGTAGMAQGSYSINNTTGVITFDTADEGNATSVTYLYTPASGINSNTVKLQQVGMNSAQTFQLTLLGTGAKNIYTNQPQQFIAQFNTCLAPSLKMDFKMDDFTMLDLDYQAFIDVYGNLGSFFMINPAG